MEELELHLIFEGRVQGVGFRAAVLSLALKLGVTGTVRNLPGGTVELEAQASKETLEALITAIQKQFPASRCSSITYTLPTKKFSSFQIIFQKYNQSAY